MQNIGVCYEAKLRSPGLNGLNFWRVTLRTRTKLKGAKGTSNYQRFAKVTCQRGQRYLRVCLQIRDAKTNKNVQFRKSMDFPRAPKHFETHPSGFFIPATWRESHLTQNSKSDSRQFWAKQFTHLKSEIMPKNTTLAIHPPFIGEDINLGIQGIHGPNRLNRFLFLLFRGL